MSEAADGNTVEIHYKGTFPENGEVFDSSEGKEPLKFTVGSGQVIPGFENAVVGMKEGDEKTIDIPSDEAYGEYKEELKQTVERGAFPEHITPEVGQVLQVSGQAGNPMLVTVAECSDESVVLDANHPLAGRDLRFDIKLVSIA